jgi:uncharacterized protein (TIGR00375 family)
MNLENIDKWAKIKGLDLMTTADFTHPQWFKNIKKKLTETNSGIYQLKNSSNSTNFIINTELSFIYNHHKVHLLVFAPNIKTAEEINHLLNKKGVNLASDGRPILGIPPRKFIKITQKINPDIFYLPAHIWTPWFSLFGSKSGYNSIKECFGKYANQITAVETGLSSDPLMNWQIKELDNRVITSFSDAHSPANLGREISVFKLPKEFTYQDIITALKIKNNPQKFLSMTIEFHPQEGKYHYTGHRKCSVCHSPQTTKKLGITCPVCGKTLTVGVMHQVSQLSRNKEIKPKTCIENGLKIICHPENTHHPFIRLIPLQEIIAEAENVGVKTKTVAQKYNLATTQLDSEINILTKTPLDRVTKILGKKISQGIKRNRLGKVSIQPGYDGLYGEVKIWENETERDKVRHQKALF